MTIWRVMVKAPVAWVSGRLPGWPGSGAPVKCGGGGPAGERGPEGSGPEAGSGRPSAGVRTRTHAQVADFIGKVIHEQNVAHATRQQGALKRTLPALRGGGPGLNAPPVVLSCRVIVAVRHGSRVRASARSLSGTL